MKKALFGIVLIALSLTPAHQRTHVKLKEHAIVRSHNIKVLTINMWGLPFNSTKAARLKALGPELKRIDADIVLLQELWEKKDYDTVVKNCSYPFRTEYGPFPYIGNYSGMAILSKYPILKTERINYLWKNKLPNYVKAAMRTEILVAGRKISVFNTHLTANLEVSIGSEENVFGKIMFTSDCEEGTRWGQLQTLTMHLEKARLAGTPVILGGDLNTGPRYPLWYKWQRWLKSYFPGLCDSMSYTTELPSTYKNDYAKQDQGQLDHVMAFGAAKVLNSKVVLKEKKYICSSWSYIYSNISDHFGVLSTIEIALDEK